MTLSFVAMALLAISIHLPSVRGQGDNPCNCQCRDLETIDTLGRPQGNCKSELQGEPWCYVDQLDSYFCDDSVLSVTTNEYWSKIACQNRNCKPEDSDLNSTFGKVLLGIFEAFVSTEQN